jgi:hypothetical protein
MVPAILQGCPHSLLMRPRLQGILTAATQTNAASTIVQWNIAHACNNACGTFGTDVAIYIKYTRQSASEQTNAFEVNNTNCGHTLPTVMVVYQTLRYCTSAANAAGGGANSKTSMICLTTVAPSTSRLLNIPEALHSLMAVLAVTVAQ